MACALHCYTSVPFETSFSAAGRSSCGVRPALLSTPSKRKSVPLKHFEEITLRKMESRGSSRHVEPMDSPQSMRRPCLTN